MNDHSDSNRVDLDEGERDGVSTAGNPKRRKAQTICVIMLIAMLIGGLGFVYKLVQFAREAMGDEAASFAIVPVIVYISVAAGFVSMFLWALSRGQFSDVERPKYLLLEREGSYE